MFKPKRQNTLFLAGWILSAKWVMHDRLNEQVLACLIRSDRVKYGGHHTVYVRDELAHRLYIALAVFASAAPFNRYEDVEKIPFALLDEFFLMVTVDGVLYFNDIVALHIRCLNLNGKQRQRVKDLFDEFKYKRRLAALQPRRPIGQDVRP